MNKRFHIYPKAHNHPTPVIWSLHSSGGHNPPQVPPSSGLSPISTESGKVLSTEDGNTLVFEKP
jgi:hypothetical protein